MIGYIKLHRQITRWEWYTDVNTKSLFLHCLLMANHKDNQWRGIEIKAGSFITSLRKLSTEVGLTVSQIRTSINKLEMTQEIAQESHTSYTILKVLNYAVYQGKLEDEENNIAQESHNKSQSNRTPNRTRNSNKQELKENKNEKNDKEVLKEESHGVIFYDDVEILDEWENMFKKFWNVYPKKKSKGDAEKWFKKHKPNEELFNYMLFKINELKQTKDWTKESGKYIPYPTTWLNAKGWEDEVIKDTKYSSMEAWANE